MPRIARDSRLETREARRRLTARHEPYWRLIDKGFYLGYRRGKANRAGTWITRLLIDGKYVKKSLGNTDDFRDDNKADVLSYKNAQVKARKWANDEIKKQKGITNGEHTVADAVADYLDWYSTHRKAYRTTQITFDAHILPRLGDKKLADLTTKDIRGWHQSLVKKKARSRTGLGRKQNTRETKDLRPRKSTANRILTTLKAALNHAWREGYIESNQAWRKVAPFRNVDIPKIHYLKEKECERLINACPPDFRLMVQGALYTGCRYGELTNLKCGDFDSQSGTITITDSKSGGARHVPVTEMAQAFFKRIKVGRKGADFMFKRDDGEPWGRSHQVRLIRKACKIAKIDPPAAFHVLRHTYGTALAQNGVPLQVIAEALGHADTRITSKHYAHLMPSYVADTIRANLPDFGKFKGDSVVGMEK